jgi:plastocyanin
MFATGRTGRRVGLIAAIAVAGLLFAGGIAFAASQTIVAGPGNSFSTATYTSDQGDVVQFQNLGGSHNVTARATGPGGGPLFQSATTSSGTTPVNGTQFLTTGDYAFFCSVHPTEMNATLRITGAGTPQARPQIALSIRTKTIAKALKKGLLIALNTNTKVTGASIIAKLGKTTIGRADNLALAQGQVFEVVRLNKAGKAKLRQKDKATVTVTASIPGGAAATAKGKLK